MIIILQAPNLDMVVYVKPFLNSLFQLNVCRNELHINSSQKIQTVELMKLYYISFLSFVVKALC